MQRGPTGPRDGAGANLARRCCIWRSLPSTSSTRVLNAARRRSGLIALSNLAAVLAGNTSTLIRAGNALHPDATVPVGRGNPDSSC